MRVVPPPCRCGHRQIVHARMAGACQVSPPCPCIHFRTESDPALCDRCGRPLVAGVPAAATISTAQIAVGPIRADKLTQSGHKQGEACS